ncbi:MAG: LysR family transcriptional regulator [Myxococcota bacterium]
MPESGYADALTVDQLRVLVAVVDTGSFSGAAQMLGRSQSAVSYQVASLETQLGLTLFRRTRRRPELTPEGRAMLRSATEILEGFERLRARASKLGHVVEARVRLAIDVLYPAPRLAAHLRAFEAEFDGVEIDLRAGVRDEPARALAAQQADVAVVPEAGAFEARACTRAHLVAVTAPSHPLATLRGPISDGQLARHVHLVLADGLPLDDDAGERRWRFNDSVTRRELLLAGVGWCRVPRHEIAADLDSGRLVALRTRRFGRKPQLVQLFAASPRGRVLGPAAQWWFDQL